MSITVYQGSILDVEADCIVNPANSFLNHDGGLARIIRDAAAPLARFDSMDTAYYNTGEDLALYDQDIAWAYEQAAAPLIATGNVHVTSAGRLPYKGIIHAVGPIWNGGHFHERPLLKAAHANACAEAHKRGWKSIAFPAISCGIFGFPVEQAAKSAMSGVQSWARPQPHGLDMGVTFALFEQAHVDAYNETLYASRREFVLSDVRPDAEAERLRAAMLDLEPYSP